MAVDKGKIIGIPSAASGVSYDNTDSGLTSTNVQDAINEVCDDLSNKVDKVTGKGLSTNDYDDTAKGIVDGVTSALAGKASTNDLGDKSNLTTTDKSSAVAAINEVNTVTTTSITALSLSGITLSWLDNIPDSHKAIRVGNMVIVNVGLDIDGVFTGTTGWIPVYDLPSSLLKSGESFITPHFTAMMCYNRRNDTVYGALVDGRLIYLDTSTDEYHLRLSGQMILPIVKS